MLNKVWVMGVTRATKELTQGYITPTLLKIYPGNVRKVEEEIFLLMVSVGENRFYSLHF